jgi:hypothetical protein
MNMNVYDIVSGKSLEIKGRVQTMLQDGTLARVLPEFVALMPKQGFSGHKDNFWHTVQVICQTHDLGGSEDLKVVALMHDLGKGATARYDEKRGWTFHMHEEVGARIVDAVFERQGLCRKKAAYVKNVMIFSGRMKSVTEEGVTDSAVRRYTKELFDATIESEAGFASVLADVVLFSKADITTRHEDKKIEFRRRMDEFHSRVCAVIKADEDSRWRMSVDAHEIMRATGLEPGRLLGEIKKKLEQLVKSGELPDDPAAILDKAQMLLNKKPEKL